jgi:bifunctional ADP-heptose synthase (sugar kinase/adenylyltransferase)
MKIITVIGEKCIDEFIYGKCTRLNPEAPTPVFVEGHRKENLGMAANVAKNISSLNESGLMLFEHHQEKEIRKTRFVDDASNYILLRVDSEKGIDRIKIDPMTITEIESSDLLVVSDYDKGFLHPEDLRTLARHAKVSVIDTKKPINEIWAREFSFIKMNSKEWENPAHENKEAYLEKMIVTQGKDGAMWNGKSYKGVEVEVMDVAGAGDSFLAGFSHMWVKTGSVERSIEFANEIAAHVVRQRGVVNQIIF